MGLLYHQGFKCRLLAFRDNYTVNIVIVATATYMFVNMECAFYQR